MHASDAQAAGSRHDPARPQCGAGDAIGAVVLLPDDDAAGEVVFLLADGRNITAKKQAEAEAVRKNAQLQRLLDRITQLDQRKRDMVANVSHELRTPLTLILGPVEELLLDGAHLGERERQQLRLVQRTPASAGRAPRASCRRPSPPRSTRRCRTSTSTWPARRRW